MIKNYSYDILVAVSIFFSVSIQFADPLKLATKQSLKQETIEMAALLDELSTIDLNDLSERNIIRYLDSLETHRNHYTYFYYKLTGKYPKTLNNELFEHNSFDIDIRYKTVKNQLEYLLIWKR